MTEKVGKQGIQNNGMKLNQSGAHYEYTNKFKYSVNGIMLKIKEKKTIN